MTSSAHRACDDFHATSESSRRAYLGSGLTRRQVIGRGIGAGLAVYASRAMSIAGVFEAAEASAAGPPAPVLVSVFLPGGCDLLDTLVPLERYGRYADLRPRIRQRDAAPLGSSGLGVHPALTRGRDGGIQGLYERGRIGFLPGIDYANPDLSHFHSRRFWETGLVTGSSATGWLGRLLDRAGGGDNPLQGLSMSNTLSPLLRSAKAPVAALLEPNAAQFWVPDLDGRGRAAAVKGWERLSHRPAQRPGERAALRAGRQATSVVTRVTPYAAHGGADPLAGTIAYPDDRFAACFKHLAGMIAAPLGIRVATVELDGGFDTHDNQPRTLDVQLSRVSTALSAFQADLEARGVADRVLTFVWSEFGRRPVENESAGTDHGAGGLAWVQGTRARAGILSDYPELGGFDADGNLAVTVDFRRVYSSLMEQWLDVDAAGVIPSAARLGRLALVA
jgi:uncharacterized protein (DUF1501 family)